MLTAETLRRIAPKQGDAVAETLLEYTADLLERRGLEFTLAYLKVGTERNNTPLEVALQPLFGQLLEIMRSPEEINEWTPVGGDTDE